MKNCSVLKKIVLTTIFLTASRWAIANNFNPQRVSGPAVTGALQSLAVMQGATTYHSTQIAVLGLSTNNLKFDLTDNSGTTYQGRIEKKGRSTSAWVVYQLFYDALPAGKEFTLLIHDSKGRLIDQRFVKTFDQNKKVVRIALASCMSDAPIFPKEKIWEALRLESPDAIFFLGDNVYASIKDPISPPYLWERYAQTRSILPLFRFRHLIPVFATWDDHDFGQNNGDKSYPYIKESQEVFRSFFPQEPIDNEINKGPGISQAIKLFNRQFLFLDDRSFRDAPGGATMWGKEQDSWLNEALMNDTSPVWIINGSQFFGKYGPSESLEKDFPNHFNRFVQTINAIDRPVTFISGDIHASEVMRIPVSLIEKYALEITSSSMHSIHRPEGSLPLNPRRLVGYDDDNFTIVTFGQEQKDHLQIEGFNREREIVFKHLEKAMP